MNVVKVLVSMPAVHVPSSSDLTHCFGLAGKHHTFYGRAFDVLFKKIQVQGKCFGFSFRVLLMGLSFESLLWV